MNIDRHEDQGGRSEAVRRLKFCLDQLENRGFAEEGRLELRFDMLHVSEG
jgi:hypothetical protein